LPKGDDESCAKTTFSKVTKRAEPKY
jgi:hypothetical protein